MLVRALAGALCAICGSFSKAAATPAIVFPFNSQVPVAARVDQPFNFQISESTFAPSGSSYSYTLANQPAWLKLDSATRTLSGTPGAGDAGSGTFLLTAADSTGAAVMECTLVVSNDPAPQLVGNVSKQLAKTANLSSGEPPVVTLLPSTYFNFDFEPESFIDIVQRKLYYYASLSDHTPLPSWILFDPDLLSLSGTAPDLTAFPQSWKIDLIASDIAGFAGTVTSFTVVIGAQLLVFVPEEQEVHVRAGRAVSITMLPNELFSNNVQVDLKDLKSAVANVPSWLTFNAATLGIEGTAPSDFTGANLTITVTDQPGNTASAIVHLVPGNTSLFNGQISTLTAAAGERFEYHFEDSLFTELDLDLQVSLPPGSNWLSYNAETRALEGTPPVGANADQIRVQVRVNKSGSDDIQTQTLTIDLKGASTIHTSSSTSSSKHSPSPTLPTATSLAVDDEHESGLSGGAIAIIVLSIFLAFVMLLVALVWYFPRRRRSKSYVDQSPHGTPSKNNFSQPLIASQGTQCTAVTTQLQRDVEKGAGEDSDSGFMAGEAVPTLPPNSPRHGMQAHEAAPQIPKLVLPSPSPVDGKRKSRMKWSKRFSRISLASSLGVGEAAIEADENIPEWGHTHHAAIVHSPHDSFSVPAEMARKSRHLGESASPSKRALQRLRDRTQHRRKSTGSFNRLSVRLGARSIDDRGGIACYSSRDAKGRHYRHRSSFGALSTTREDSSIASRSTRGTSLLARSVLSTRPSDFPNPPNSLYGTTVSIPNLRAFEELKRKSIRIVGRSDSVATTADDRPMDVKRQSFIKKRASGQSPLFAHGSRQSSLHLKPAGANSANTSVTGSAKIGSRRGKGMLTTYSESSSLESHPLGHKDSPHRHSRQRLSQRFTVRNPFAPNYPRAVTKSTLYDNDGRSTLYDETGGPSRASRAQITSTSDWTSDSLNSADWIAELSKPRQERTFVLPGEASPTPPPAALSERNDPETQNCHSTSSVTSGGERNEVGSVNSAAERLRQRLVKQQQLRQRSATLLASQKIQRLSRPSPSVLRRAHGLAKNRLSEPLSLVSADSMHKGRPRLGNARWPVSVEEMQRLSSMRAENDAATTAGSERNLWLTEESEDEMRADGVVGPLGGADARKKGDTVRSDMSGAAFL